MSEPRRKEKHHAGTGRTCDNCGKNPCELNWGTASCYDNPEHHLWEPTAEEAKKLNLKPCCIANDLSVDGSSEPHWQLRMKADRCPHRRPQEQGEAYRYGKDIQADFDRLDKMGGPVGSAVPSDYAEDKAIPTCGFYDGNAMVLASDYADLQAKLAEKEALVTALGQRNVLLTQQLSDAQLLYEELRDGKKA